MVFLSLGAALEVSGNGTYPKDEEDIKLALPRFLIPEYQTLSDSDKLSDPKMPHKICILKSCQLIDFSHV